MTSGSVGLVSLRRTTLSANHPRAIPMSQNMISISFTPDDLAQVDAALTQLEQSLTVLIALTPDERRELHKMGDKSEAFCRQTVSLMAQNPTLIPPSLDVAEAQRDLAALESLRPRTQRLSRLMSRLEDSETALGSDLMTFATSGYALLRIAGKGQGLDAALGNVSARWKKRASKTSAPETAPASPMN